MPKRRTQIYLTEEEHLLLARESERTGRSVAALIREAIDRVFGDVEQRDRKRFQKMLRETAGAWSSMTDAEAEELERFRHSWGERDKDLNGGRSD